MPLGHLALDDVRVRSSSAHGVEPSEAMDDGPTPGGVGGLSVVRGKKRSAPRGGRAVTRQIPVVADVPWNGGPSPDGRAAAPPPAVLEALARETPEGIP